MTATLTYKRAYANDCDSTTGWTRGVTLILAAAAYTNCVDADRGKKVCKIVGGLVDSEYGTLITFDNATFTWWTDYTGAVALEDGWTMQISDAGVGIAPNGTGIGTSTTCITHTAQLFTSDGDIFTLTATTANAGATEGFYEELHLSTNYSTTSYPCLTIRFKTDAAAGTGLQAKVQILYTDHTEVAPSLTESVLGCTTTWEVNTVTLTSGKSIDKIRLFAIEDIAGNPNNTHYVYYDWFIFHEGTFTFPHVGPGGVSVNHPVKIAQLPIPGRDGDILQHLGLGSVEITVRGDVLEGETWRSATTVPHFDYLIKSLLLDDWCYFTCDRPLIRCQVMFRDFSYETSGEDMKFQWVMRFYVFKLGAYSSFSEYDYIWGTT